MPHPPQRPKLAAPRAALLPRRRRPAPHHLADGREEDAAVEADGAVGDVLHVMRELVRPGLLAGDPRLREPRPPGPTPQPLPVLRDLAAEPGEEGGADRARPDDRHVAAEHVPQLRHLVQVHGTEDAADPPPLLPRAA